MHCAHNETHLYQILWLEKLENYDTLNLQLAGDCTEMLFFNDSNILLDLTLLIINTCSHLIKLELLTVNITNNTEFFKCFHIYIYALKYVCELIISLHTSVCHEFQKKK